MARESHPHLTLLAQLGRFLLVGAAGFIIDLSVLTALIRWAGWDVVVGRVASITLAVSVTFVLNAKATFHTRLRDASFLRYVGVQALGAGLNLGLYVVMVLPLNVLPELALIVSACCASLHNFLWVRRVVY